MSITNWFRFWRRKICCLAEVNFTPRGCNYSNSDPWQSGVFFCLWLLMVHHPYLFTFIFILTLAQKQRHSWVGSRGSHHFFCSNRLNSIFSSFLYYILREILFLLLRSETCTYTQCKTWETNSDFWLPPLAPPLFSSRWHKLSRKTVHYSNVWNILFFQVGTLEQRCIK